MALQLDTIRNAAERVAASHQLDVVEVEFSGGQKFRTLRIFIEKNEAGRAALVELARNAEAGAPLDPLEPLPALPSGVAPELLSGVTHEDCTQFAQDFSVLLDVEELIPGAEYTLEVSSPGLERKLIKPADYTRFTGSLAKLQTFTAVALEEGKTGTRHLSGRIVSFASGVVTLDLAAVKPKGKGRKAPAAQVIAIPLANVEKAQLIPEI